MLLHWPLQTGNYHSVSLSGLWIRWCKAQSIVVWTFYPVSSVPGRLLTKNNVLIFLVQAVVVQCKPKSTGTMRSNDNSIMRFVSSSCPENTDLKNLTPWDLSLVERFVHNFHHTTIHHSYQAQSLCGRMTRVNWTIDISSNSFPICNSELDKESIVEIRRKRYKLGAQPVFDENHSTI